MFFLFSLIKCCLDLFDQSPLKGLQLVQMFPMITAVFILNTCFFVLNKLSVYYYFLLIFCLKHKNPPKNGYYTYYSHYRLQWNPNSV